MHFVKNCSTYTDLRSLKKNSSDIRYFLTSTELTLRYSTSLNTTSSKDNQLNQTITDQSRLPPFCNGLTGSQSISPFTLDKLLNDTCPLCFFVVGNWTIVSFGISEWGIQSSNDFLHPPAAPPSLTNPPVIHFYFKGSPG